MANNPTNQSIRLDPSLMQLAYQIGTIMRRSVPKQIEYWAELGRLVENTLDKNGILAVLQGFKKIKLEDVHSKPIDPEEVFAEVSKINSGQNPRGAITKADFYFEASSSHPGYLDKVNTVSKEKQTGKFHNGKFEAMQ